MFFGDNGSLVCDGDIDKNRFMFRLFSFSSAAFKYLLPIAFVMLFISYMCLNTFER